jgi:hypothetical protein
LIDNVTAASGVALDSNGQATFSTATLAAGSRSVTVSYNSDANFTASTSSPLAQQVDKATPPDRGGILRQPLRVQCRRHLHRYSVVSCAGERHADGHGRLQRRHHRGGFGAPRRQRPGELQAPPPWTWAIVPSWPRTTAMRRRGNGRRRRRKQSSGLSVRVCRPRPIHGSTGEELPKTSYCKMRSEWET